MVMQHAEHFDKCVAMMGVEEHRDSVTNFALNAMIVVAAAAALHDVNVGRRKHSNTREVQGEEPEVSHHIDNDQVLDCCKGALHY